MTDDVFAKMRQVELANAREEKQFSFQERIVRQLLRRANIQLQTKSAKAAALEMLGNDHLGFDWFYEQYPKFPLRLLSQKLQYTHTATLGDIYGQSAFQKLPWWREYIQQAAIYNVDLAKERAALIFNLPYAKNAFLMVLHNQPIQGQIIRDAESRHDQPWPRTTFPMKHTGVVAVLESFDSFLQTVGTDWVD